MKVRRCLQYFFYALDLLWDRHFLKAMSWLFKLEAYLRGVDLGYGLLLGRPVIKIAPHSKVIIGNQFILVSNQRRSSSGSIYAPCRLQTHSKSSEIILGENVSANGVSIVSRSCRIVIGDNTMFAPNCVVMDSPWHNLWPPLERLTYRGIGSDQEVIIGKNVWVGVGCLILPGAVIGDNSVIAARSLVTGVIPPNSLAMGSPARVVRDLSASY